MRIPGFVFFSSAIFGVAIAFASPGSYAAADDSSSEGKLVQFGEMHVAIGQQEHGGRVRLGDLVKRPHFYAVAALEGLTGEVTIHNGQVTVTTVQEGRLQPAEGSLLEKQATLLVGAYVPSWKEVQVANDVAPEKFDAFVENVAQEVGIATDTPFVFTVQGDLLSVRMHVINGACPIRARMKKIRLPKEQQPVESEMAEVTGTVVGVFAKDAVGRLTHPATSMHGHVLVRDPATGNTVTGHLEQVGIKKGSVLRVPAH